MRNCDRFALSQTMKVTERSGFATRYIENTLNTGLKSQFGTMGKPYNAGIAASNGVECATLAALGFTSCDDGLLDRQGFLPTHSYAIDEAAAFLGVPARTLPGMPHDVMLNPGWEAAAEPLVGWYRGEFLSAEG